MKKISKLTVITTLITLLPIVLGIALYDRLPDVVATHWGIDNQPNGWSSRAICKALFNPIWRQPTTP